MLSHVHEKKHAPGNDQLGLIYITVPEFIPKDRAVLVPLNASFTMLLMRHSLSEYSRAGLPSALSFIIAGSLPAVRPGKQPAIDSALPHCTASTAVPLPPDPNHRLHPRELEEQQGVMDAPSEQQENPHIVLPPLSYRRVPH